MSVPLTNAIDTLRPRRLFEGAGDDRVRLTYARDGQVEKLARWRADLVANGVS